jgi:pimeloyl-ACP methyl ester carboxylesterase
MMTERTVPEKLHDFPYFELEFNKSAELDDPDGTRPLLDHLTATKSSDLLVISHGWRNNMDDALQLYKNLLGNMRSHLPKADSLNGRTFAVAGVMWPSKKYDAPELTAGGAAGLGSPPVGKEQVKAELEELAGFFDLEGADEKLQEAIERVDRLETPAAQREFAALIRPLLPESFIEEAGDVPDAVFKLDDFTLMKRLGQRSPLELSGSGGGGAAIGPGLARRRRRLQGSAARFGSFLRGPVGAAKNLLTFVTYYQMKHRAGQTGAGGLNKVLRQVRATAPQLKIHLIGHSFGGRLVSAAAGAPQTEKVGISSMSLLQAAFSHYGFARNYDGQNDGFFRAVVTDQRVTGPMVITHTAQDKAVGLAYPIASRVAGHAAAGLGDKNDPYGGIGRNGAQKTPEAVDGDLLAAGRGYQFEAGQLYNLLADNFINDHNDVTGAEVAWAILSAVAAT